MDLSQFDTTKSNSATMAVRHPETGEELLTADGAPITIDLIGVDHPDHVKAQHAQTTRRVSKSAARGRVRFTGAELDADALELTVLSIAGWKNVILDGELLEFSALNARKLLTRLPWLREQVDNFRTDRTNYLGN